MSTEQRGPGNTAWSAGTKPAGRDAYAAPAVSWKDADLHSDSSLPRNSQLTLNKALNAFKSISSSRAENNKTKHAVCKMTSSSCVQSGYLKSIGSRITAISLSLFQLQVLKFSENVIKTLRRPNSSCKATTRRKSTPLTFSSSALCTGELDGGGNSESTGPLQPL